MTEGDWKKRTLCGTVDAELSGTEVCLMGWVDAVRDHGNLIFIHLRDVSGIVQVVFAPGPENAGYEAASGLGVEYAVSIDGEVGLRTPSTRNPHLRTGDVEVYARSLRVLSPSAQLPFQISEKAMVFGEEVEASPVKVDEDLRLQYRYLDIRRPSVQQMFIKRHRIVKTIRDFLDERGFFELETPILTKSTPEGARDYLVPSRVHKGSFYALPQSPQIFKQLFMVGGLDRYFQIARCFRDEDLRPNRQPEFTQLDLEASFIDEEFIYELMEALMVKLFGLDGLDLAAPFPRMTYAEAVEKYGTDRPDLRFEMTFADASGILRETGYSVIRSILAAGGRVKGFCVKGRSRELSKNLLQNEYAMKIVPAMGAGGLTWMKVEKGELRSNIVQFFSSGEKQGLVELFGAGEGDVIMMIADSSPQIVNRVLGDLRLHLARRLSMIDSGVFKPVWVTDFPLFEYRDERIISQHHPFTMPDRIDFDPSDLEDLLKLNSRAYDLVINGEELGGGSLRIHRMDVQSRVFQALGLTRRETNSKFGFFLKALSYGTPPHGGIAVGLDRLAAMILQTDSIRDVIPFPKNRSAVCPLTEAPSEVNQAQLEELGLNISGDKSGGKSAPGEEENTISEERPELISSEEVFHVARLARLTLDENEVESLKGDLNPILEYVEDLRKLEPPEEDPPGPGSANVWREDIPGPACDGETILENAPDREETYFKVPRILEG